MSDYRQPEFYRFNEDSLLLVNEMASKAKAGLLLDMGAGSGIIGIELAIKMNSPEVHFLELQQEWRPVLEENIQKFIPGKITKTFWTSMGEWHPKPVYDLIAGNPPYYLPGKGIRAPDPVRAKCRSFEVDGWAVLLQKSYEALRPEGSAWFVTREENLSHVQEVAGTLKLICDRRGDLVLIRLDKNRHHQ